ncbi:MAG: helix-turn-helix domain-containing protein [Rhizobiaceae bacterium]
MLQGPLKAKSDTPGQTAVWRDVDCGQTIAARHQEEIRLALCEAMIDLTAALFNVPSKEVRRSGRTSRSICRVRQIAMYVCHVVLGLSMRDVGRGFGRDRTTVLHACHQVEDLREDEDFDRVVALAERVALAAFRSRETLRHG